MKVYLTGINSTKNQRKSYKQQDPQKLDEKLKNYKNEKEEIKKIEEKKLKTDIDQEKAELKILPFFEEVGFNTKSSKEFKGEVKIFHFFWKDG